MVGTHIRGWRILAAVVIPGTLTGCMTFSDGGGASLSPEERTLRQEAQVFNETVLGGAAAGAAIGGLTCMLFGSSLGDCATEAAIGAAVGGIAGYVTASKQQAANEQVRATDIVTRDLHAENERLASLVATARRVLEENRASNEELRARIANNEAEAGEIDAQRRRIQSNVEVLNGVIANLNEKRSQYTEVAGNLDDEGEDTAALRKEVREMSEQIDLLVDYRTALEEELDVELMG